MSFLLNNWISILFWCISTRIAWKAWQASKRAPLLSIYYFKNNRILENIWTDHIKDLNLEIIDIFINKNDIPTSHWEDEIEARQVFLNALDRISSLQWQNFIIWNIRINQKIKINNILLNQYEQNDKLSIFNEKNKIIKKYEENNLEYQKKYEKYQQENYDAQEIWNDDDSDWSDYWYKPEDHLHRIEKMIVIFKGFNKFKKEWIFQK